MLASMVLISALAATGQVDETWEAVNSKDGQFSVEMPAATSQSGSGPIMGPAGPVPFHETMRQTGGLIYMVGRIEAGRPIRGADEARWLDLARDKATRWYAGKRGQVVSEKKSRLGPIEGREYTIKVPGPPGETYHMKGRAYVKGSTVYTLLVATASGSKGVPAKGTRFLDSFSFGARPDVAKAGEKDDDGVVAPRKAGGAGRWPVVTTDLGKFSVEMPRQPTGRESGGASGPFGAYEYQGKTAHGNGLDYTIMVMEHEAEIPESGRARALDYGRNQGVANFGGVRKVVSEKAIPIGGAEGREFTLTLERGVPPVPVNARGRVLVRGKMIGVVAAAMSNKDQALPAEVDRFLASFAAGSLPEAPMAKAEPAVARPGGPAPNPMIAAASGGLMPAFQVVTGLMTRDPLAVGVRLLASIPSRAAGPGAPMPAPRPREAASPRPAPSRAPGPLTAEVLNGDWKVEGKELVQTSREPKAIITFGDEAWSSYNLNYEAKIVEGVEGTWTLYHYQGPGDYVLFYTGGFKNTTQGIARFLDGKLKRTQVNGSIDRDRWHKISVVVRGAETRCLVDGAEVMKYKDESLTRGRVGLGTHHTVVRFRNVEITSPEGEVWFKGLPKLPDR